MLESLNVLAQCNSGPVLADLMSIFGTAKSYLLIFAGFSLVIFVHELGHFVAAKLSGVKVDKFAIGFGREIFGFTRGETRYAFNILPLGGYVKMLGQEDFAVDKSGEIMVKDDPRAFTHKPVGVRMIIVSAGVFMNLVFAALTFAIVFMVGMQSIPAVVGQLQPGMPAEQAGLRIGDRIVEVNGQAITDQVDLQTAIGLSDPDESLKLKYERKDHATGNWKAETVSISPEMSPENNILRIGVAPPATSEVGMAIRNPDLPADQQLQVGDEIMAVNGAPISSFWELQARLADCKGDWAKLTVERPVAAASQPAGERVRGGEKKTVELRWRARQYFMPTGKADQDSGNLLGFVPRQRVKQVIPKDRGDVAGIEDGDVIVRWGGQIGPRMDEIIESRRENPERDIRVTVYRAGDEKNVILRPRGGGLLARGVPADGIMWGSQENDKLVVADIATNVTDKIKTPAAAIKDAMPRGSLLTKVNGEPVQTWEQLAERFIKLAGTRVKLTWTNPGAGEQSGEIYVPQTIGTTFDLPGSRHIISIDGTSRCEVDFGGGRRTSLSVNHWRAASEVLRGCLEKGLKEVKVVYDDSVDHNRREVMVPLSPEMVDTWVQRTNYVVDDVLTFNRLTTIREPNPLKASMIGLRKTWYFIEQVYLVMQRMIFTRSMSVEQVSGPVGIIQVGSQIAASGTTHLMYFLALISANLAVINFLPLPIMDGGVFLFLLIEKIKGSPLSLRVQVATQLIGLVLIIGIFVFVTFQDVVKLWG